MRKYRIQGLAPSVLVVVFTLAYLIAGYRTLDEESRQVPIITAWLTLIMLGLDLFMDWRGKRAAMPVKEGPDVRLTDEVRAVLSLVGVVIAIYLLGFYVGGILYLFLSLYWIGGQGLRFSTIVTASAFVGIYFLFERALALQLFRGVLLS